MRAVRFASAFLLTLAVATASATGETLLVHLPSAPVENSSRLASAVTALASHLNAEVPRLDLEVKMFRRWEDAFAFYETDPGEVTAILSESAFLLDLPRGAGFTPMWRLSRDGRESYRLVLVVKAGHEAVRKLSDLRGKRLAFVKVTGPQSQDFLARAVFGGELAPETWFESLEAAADDFTAVAAVLHGQVDAALVADHNPLLRADLGTKLTEVFSSPSLSNPVLSLRTDALDADQQSALANSLSRIGESADGAKLLSELGLDGLHLIAGGERVALLGLPTVSRKRLEIALPTTTFRPSAVATGEAVDSNTLTFALAIALPDTASVSALEPEP